MFKRLSGNENGNKKFTHANQNSLTSRFGFLYLISVIHYSYFYYVSDIINTPWIHTIGSLVKVLI